jgi:uncharacterized membrane protein
MESRTKFLGHPVHQTLVAFPVGLLVVTTVFDLIHAFSQGATSAVVAYWMLAAGLIAAVVAAPFGAVDWLAIPKGTRAKRIGALHGAGNGVVLVLYGLSFWLRDVAIDPPTAALILSVFGALLAAVTAWLGGELVSRLGVGISDEAGLDAPSSLGTRGTPPHPPRAPAGASPTRRS